MPELSKVLTGCALGAVSFVALMLNVSVLTVIIGGKFLKENSPTVYIITFLNVIGDAMQVGLILIYLTPASIAQSWIFPYGPDGAGAKTFAYLFQIQWYQCVLTQILMALNRFVMVLLPECKFLFSRRMVIIYCSLVFPSSFILSVIADIVLPCCTTYFYYGKFSYSFFGNGTNYKNLAMDIPLNALTSGTSLTCYFIIFIVVRRANRNGKVKINSNAMLRRRQNEIRYALQFGLISLFFLAAWVSFRIFPLVLPSDVPEFFSFVAFCVMLHCSANSFIYLTMNKEFKMQFARYFGFIRSASTLIVTTVSPSNPPRSSMPPVKS